MGDVLLIGMGPTALSALDSLTAKLNVVGIIRDTDTEAEMTDPVVFRAKQLGIPIFSEVSPTAIEVLVLRLRPDCVVVSSYNRIFKPPLIAQCPFINVHYAPLPKYRGRANVNWALINDELCTAITIHTIVPGLDAGNILFQRLIPIQDNHTVADLYERLNNIQREQLADAVAVFLDGYEGVPQHPEEATYGCTRIPEDGEISWAASTRKIYCLVRALAFPFPGAYTFFKGKPLTVWKAEPLENPPNFRGRVLGRVVGVSRSEGYVDVLTGDGVLRIFEVQCQGEGRSPAAGVINSVRDTLGLRTIDLLKRIQALEQQVAKLSKVKKEGAGGYVD